MAFLFSSFRRKRDLILNFFSNVFSGRFMKCAINRKSVSFKNSDFLLASSKPLRILLTSKLFSTDEFFGEKRPSIKASFVQKLHPASCKNVFHKTLQYAT